jgi:hypothetical protein
VQTEEGIRILTEKHYRLVAPDDLSEQEIEEYRKRTTYGGYCARSKGSNQMQNIGQALYFQFGGWGIAVWFYGFSNGLNNR